jgi:signal transduction histidine kinase
MKQRHKSLILIGWISIIVLSFFLNIYLMKLNTLKLVKNRAESFFSEIVITRLWNSNHGSVYVPLNEKTQANPYLKVPNRDIVTTTGQKLTMINPAYMTRQIAELADKYNTIKYHITSLDPIRPANKADKWEAKVLKVFEGNPEGILQKDIIDSISYYRYMAPLNTETSCLDCHAEQGYKIGDIRGGISVSFRDDIYYKAEKKQTISLGTIHLAVLLLGILGLKYYERMSSKFLLELKIKNKKLEENQTYQQQLNMDLKEINATKDRFFSIIAHDLKSPFTSTIGYSNLLLENYHKYSDEKKHEMIQTISDSSERSFNLLENLLTWSRSQRGKIKYNPEKIDLKIISQSLTELYKSQAKAKEVMLINNVQDSVELISDRNILETVLRNLISNAIKYTTAGDTIRLDCKASKNNNEIIFSVNDTGTGMEEEDLIKLFKIDESISTPGTDNEKGTGLGLILCKELLEMAGGINEVESELGKGSTFKFTLPANRI